MANRLNLGVIGVGGISRGHIKGFREIPDVEIVALADPAPAMIQSAQEYVNDPQWKPQCYSDYRPMLAEVPLDAVLICTPHTQHYQQAMDALEKGCHLFLEKPMVTRTEHARQIIRRAQETKKVVLVSYQRHYSPLYIEARNLIRSGAIGRLTATCGYLAQAYLPHCHTWRGDPEQCSEFGQFNDSGSHLVAAMLWCSGARPVRVAAFTDSGPARVNLNSATTILFDNGALGTLSINGHVAEGFEEELVFWGTAGSIYIKDGTLRLAQGSKKPEVVTTLAPAVNRYQEFVDAIRTGTPVSSDGEIGLRVTALTVAAFAANATGQVYEVDA